MKVAVINCGAEKQGIECKAKDMYIGSLFVASRKFAQTNYEQYCILSAKYHCLLPDDVIKPYDMFLGNFNKQQKQEWWSITANQLLEKFPKGTQFDFYVGQDYLEGIVPILENSNVVCNCYLNHLGMGYKIQWFNQHTKNAKRKLF